MILVDTSIWTDHFRRSEAELVAYLGQGQVLAHPFVIGELALGHLHHRDAVLDALSGLPQAVVASDSEVLGFIARAELTGLGIGYIDAHFLAAVRLTPPARLATRDKRLHKAAERLGLSLALG